MVPWLSDLLSPLLCPRHHCLPRAVYTLTLQVPLRPCIPSGGHTLFPTKSYYGYKTTRECHKILDFKSLVQYGFQSDSQVSIWFFHFSRELNKLSEIEQLSYEVNKLISIDGKASILQQTLMNEWSIYCTFCSYMCALALTERMGRWMMKERELPNGPKQAEYKWGRHKYMVEKNYNTTIYWVLHPFWPR